MTTKKIVKIVGISVFTFALVANLQFSLLNYGLKSNTLSADLFAQSGTGGGTTTGSTTTGGTTTGGTTSPYPSKRLRSCYPYLGTECAAGSPSNCGPFETLCP